MTCLCKWLTAALLVVPGLLGQQKDAFGSIDWDHEMTRAFPRGIPIHPFRMNPGCRPADKASSPCSS